MTGIDFQSIGFPVMVMTLIAAALGIVITIVFKVFETETDTRVLAVTDILPGANCGACGYSGCSGYAEALCSGEEKSTNKCSVGGAPTALELANFLGVEGDSFEAKVAQVKCQGTPAHTKNRYQYKGTMTCSAANVVQQGPGSCIFSCIGFGDCTKVCDFDAIHVVDGVAVVNTDNCTGCNKCVQTCPKSVIQLVPKRSETYLVRCSNTLSGAFVRPNCDIGCIGCQRCVKACEQGAIEMNKDLAQIDQSKCIQCGACIEVCPTHAITHGLSVRT